MGMRPPSPSLTSSCPSPPSLAFKLVTLGEMGVGKTQILNRYTNNKFIYRDQNTIGAEYFGRRIEINGTAMTAHVWDTGGQERYRSIVPLYYRDVNAAIVVYDVTSRETFKLAKRWVDELRATDPEALVALVGNKIDIPTQDQLSRGLAEWYKEEDDFKFARSTQDPTIRKDAERYANENGFIFIETSAKTGQNIDSLFLEIFAKLLRTDNAIAKQKQEDCTVSINGNEKPKNTKSSRCC